MPANLDSIDLNSDVVSGEREDGVNGFSNVSVVKSKVGLSSDAETLMDSVTSSQGQNQEPVVDEVKDFKGGNDLKEVAVGGLAWEGKMDSVYKSVDFEGENGSGSGGGDASVREAAEITETHSSKLVGEENGSCEIEGEVKAGACGVVSSSSVGEDAIQVENANVEVKVDSANDLLPHKKPGNVSPKVSSEGVENQGMEINDEQAKNSEGQNEDAAAFDERVLQEKENLESNDLNLVADSEPCVGADGNAKMASEEAGLGVGDLVWGKVRSHPWWPGQLFGCADASKKAKKYFKKDSYLIAYLGDQTFAWNEVSKIKPFRCNFSLLEKQSNLEDFHDAVHCALDEVSRRVEFGLACPCMPGYSKIKTQIIVNPGIREESCRRDGGDSFSSAASFEPAKLNDYVKELGQLPLGGIDTLEFVTARSQLLAFNRWKGYCHLPEFQFLGELLESDAEIPLSPEVKHGSEKVENAATTVGKEKPKSEDHSLHRRKRKRIYGDDEHPSEKEKCLADLIAERRSSAAKGKGGLDGEATGEMTKSSSGRKRKAVDSISDDSVMKQSKSPSSPGIDNGSSQPKKTYRVGDSILRVASQLNTSTPILKSQRCNLSIINHPSFDGAALCVASGGVTKNSVYGAPRMSKSIVSTSSSSHSYSVESSYPSSLYRALQKELKDKEEEIKKKDDFILEMKRQIDSMKEYLANNFGYHGGISNNDQGMQSHLTPSIPSLMAPQIMTPRCLTSQPIFRPTPRPLYPDQSCVDPQYHGSSSQPTP